MTATFYDAEFDGPLDLVFEAHRLCYTVNGRTQTIDCLAVLDASAIVAEGEAESAVQTGDIFVSVNGEPMINISLQRGKTEFIDEAMRILDEQENRGSRVIRFLRPAVPNVVMNADGIDILADVTILTLRQEEASLIFDEIKQREYVEKKMAREFERQQANEQRARERAVQQEALLAKAEIQKQEIRAEVIKLRELEKKFHEMQYAVDSERKRVTVMESNFYAEHIAHCSLHEVKYPDYQQALGLTIVPMKVTLVNEESEDKTTLVDCCIVTNSIHTSEVEVGDIVVQINGIPLVNNKMAPSRSDDEVRVFHERVLDTIAIARRPRTLLVLRPAGPASEAFKMTMSLTMFYVYLSAEQEKAIFSTPAGGGVGFGLDSRVIQPNPLLYGMNGMTNQTMSQFPLGYASMGVGGGLQQQQLQQQLQQQYPSIHPSLLAHQPHAHLPLPMPVPTPVTVPSIAPLSASPLMHPPPSMTPLHPSLPPQILSSYPPTLPQPHTSSHTFPTAPKPLTLGGMPLRPSEDEEISRQVDIEIRRFKAEEEMKRMQEMRRKAEEEEMVRKIEQQAMKEIEEEKKRLTALLKKPSAL